MVIAPEKGSPFEMSADRQLILPTRSFATVGVFGQRVVAGEDTVRVQVVDQLIGRRLRILR